MKKILLAIFVLTFGLVGCSTSSDVSSTDTITETDDLNREVNFTTERIYADSFIGELMYLDANLVGADLTYTSASWPEDKVSNLTNSGSDMEVVASLEPTLILTFNQDLVDQYSSIAPTYYMEYGKQDPIETVIRIADLLGLSEKATTIKEEFEARIDTIKASIDQTDLTYTIIEPTDDTIYLMGHNWARGGFILYDYLDMYAPSAAEEDYVNGNPSYLTINDEQLLTYVGDVALVVGDEGDNAFSTSEVYEQLDAVKNDQVYYMNTDYAWYDDPYAVAGQLDFFEQLFSGEL